MPRRTAAVFFFALLGGVARSGDPTGYTGIHLRAAMDSLGAIHVVFTTGGWAHSYYGRFNGVNWSSAFTFPASDPCYEPTYPLVEVGLARRAQALYGTNTGSYPNDLAYFTHAAASDTVGSGWATATIGNDGLRRSDYGLALDENDGAHMVYRQTNIFWPYFWRIIYRRPEGTEVVIKQTQAETYTVMTPAIAYRDSVVHIIWREGGSAGGTVNLFYASGAPQGPFTIRQLTGLTSGHYTTQPPDIAIAPDGHVEIVYLVQDVTGSPAVYEGVFAVDPDGATVLIDSANAEATGAAGPRIAFDDAGNRYVAWALDSAGESYYAVNADTIVALPGAGSIDVCAGTSAYYVRAAASGILYGQIGSSHFPPSAIIDEIAPNPVRRGIDADLTMLGTTFDNDEGGDAVETWEWMSDINGLLGIEEDLTLPASSLAPGMHTITFRCRDDEDVWSLPDSAALTVFPDTIPPPPVETVHIVPGLCDTLLVSWDTVTDNLGMAGYLVFRGHTAWFDLDVPVDSVEALQPPLYVDIEGFASGVKAAFYEVVPVDVDGNCASGNARAGAIQFGDGLPALHSR